MIIRASESIRGLIKRAANPSPMPLASSQPAQDAAVAMATQGAEAVGAISPDFRPLMVVSSIIGASLLLMLIIVCCFLIRRVWDRRRQAREDFDAARVRDPNLSWQEYERRIKLSHSIMDLEAESQRSAMINKSLRSRLSVDRNEDAVYTSPSLPPSPPARARSGLWGSRSRLQQAGQSPPPASPDGLDAEDKEMLLPPPPPRPPHGLMCEIPKSTTAGSPAGGSSGCQSPGHSSANSSRRWPGELPDGKKCPPAWGNNPRWSGDLRDAPPAVPPPSMLARTPPIWAHPAFRPEGSALGIVTKSFTNDTGLAPSDKNKVKPRSML